MLLGAERPTTHLIIAVVGVESFEGVMVECDEERGHTEPWRTQDGRGINSCRVCESIFDREVKNQSRDSDTIVLCFVLNP